MDTGKFTCNICSGKIRVDLDMCGDTIECPHCSNSIMVPLTGISAGMTIATYRLMKRLGMGAMGEVWLADEPVSGRKVALKILSPALTRNPAFIQRFRREVFLAARMSHPNIITAFDAGVDRGIYYLATNFVDGENVENILRRDGRMSESEALSIGLLMSEALEHAFEKHNIIHRDVKPSNIMIDKNGIPFLMDLGVSRTIDASEAVITTAGQFVGTPYYMSPEQARAEPLLGPTSDIYSLGCSLFHMLVGRVPFNAESNVEILSEHINTPPPSPRRYNPDISPACEQLILNMLAKPPMSRPQTWAAVIAWITTILEESAAGRNQGPESSSIGEDAQATRLSMEASDDRALSEKISYFSAGALCAVVVLLLIWIIIATL